MRLLVLLLALVLAVHGCMVPPCRTRAPPTITITRPTWLDYYSCSTTEECRIKLSPPLIGEWECRRGRCELPKDPVPTTSPEIVNFGEPCSNAEQCYQLHGLPIQGHYECRKNECLLIVP